MLLANVALPSFIGHWLIFIILLPLVAVIEAAVLLWLLQLRPKAALVTAIRANWRSTIAGLPLGWCMALAGVVPAGVFAYFLPDAYRNPSFQVIAFVALTGGTMSTQFTPVAMALANLLVLIPYYIVTIRIERKVVAVCHPDLDETRINRAMHCMNGLTYAMLAGLVLWWLTVEISHYYHRAAQNALHDVAAQRAAHDTGGLP